MTTAESRPPRPLALRLVPKFLPASLILLALHHISLNIEYTNNRHTVHMNKYQIYGCCLHLQEIFIPKPSSLMFNLFVI